MTGEEITYENPMREYSNYLNRLTRTSDMSLWQGHQLMLSQFVALGYGVNREQMQWLNENL